MRRKRSQNKIGGAPRQIENIKENLADMEASKAAILSWIAAFDASISESVNSLGENINARKKMAGAWRKEYIELLMNPPSWMSDNENLPESEKEELADQKYNEAVKKIHDENEEALKVLRDDSGRSEDLKVLSDDNRGREE